MPTLSLEISGRGPVIRQILTDPIRLPISETYEIGLKFFSFNNSIFNIVDAKTGFVEKNNVFRYNLNAGLGPGIIQTVEIPQGAYEITAISEYIESVLKSRSQVDSDGESLIKIIGNPNTLKSEILVDNVDISIDFTANDSLRNLLGFNSQVLQGSLTYVSDRQVNIKNDIESIRIQTSLIQGSYTSGSVSNSINADQVIYSTIRTVPPGFFQSERAANPVYLKASSSEIKNVTVRLIDQLGRDIPLSMTETVNYTFLIRKSK